MSRIIEIVPPRGAVSIFGVKLVGFTAENGMKLLLTVVLIVLFWALTRLLRRAVRSLLHGRKDARACSGRIRRSASPSRAVSRRVRLDLVRRSDPPGHGLGLGSACLPSPCSGVSPDRGLLIILRGRLFNVGDRVSMGGVRGDVIRVGFTHTTVMEMGQPPSAQMADPAMWVEARQYTGRIVTITNDKIFDTPVYNYSREFPYLWEEMHIMIPYSADRRRAEQILLDAAERNTVRISELGEDLMREMERRYFIRSSGLEPRVYYRLTDNWLELTARFVCRSHGIRELKDVLSREIIEGLDEAGIPLASTTIELTSLPPVRVQMEGSA